jgi:hypothetical protein
MVKVNIQGTERYYDGYMVSNLDLLKEAVAKNWDGVLLYGGLEGDGKSTKCSQDLAYLDPSFNIDRVCFSVDELGELMDKLPPGSAVQYDESWKSASSMNRYAQEQNKLIRMLTEKRRKRLYIGIVCATFFDLNRYFVIHRARAYVHIYAEGLQRGFFSFYNRQQKQDLYIKGKRDWNMKVVQPGFRGRFTNWMPFSSEEYELKKERLTKEKTPDEPVMTIDLEQVRREAYAVPVAFLNNNGWLKSGALQAWANAMGIQPTVLSRHLRKQNEHSAKQTALLHSSTPVTKHLKTINLKKIMKSLEEEGSD